MTQADLTGLPGYEIVAAGIADLDAGRDTPEASALRMASRRLASVGIVVPAGPEHKPASHHLYDLVAAEGQDTAHSRYNAITRRLLSFLRAAELASAR